MALDLSLLLHLLFKDSCSSAPPPPPPICWYPSGLCSWAPEFPVSHLSAEVDCLAQRRLVGHRVIQNCWTRRTFVPIRGPSQQGFPYILVTLIQDYLVGLAEEMLSQCMSKAHLSMLVNSRSLASFTKSPHPWLWMFPPILCLQGSRKCGREAPCECCSQMDANKCIPAGSSPPCINGTSMCQQKWKG